MKALFIAPDISVIAHVLGGSETVEEFDTNLSKITKGDYAKNVAEIVKSPANLRYSWVKLDKTEEDVDFFSNLAILSANNTFGVSTKDIVMTQDSVFINVNLLQAFKEVAKGSTDKDEEMDISLQDRVSVETISKITKDMFNETRFFELVTTENGAQMFMLAGCFTNDTWSILESIGPVSRKSVAMQKKGDANTKRPGFCLLFGLSMTALAQIVESSNKFSSHIKDDFSTFPRKGSEEEDEKN